MPISVNTAQTNLFRFGQRNAQSAKQQNYSARNSDMQNFLAQNSGTRKNDIYKRCVRNAGGSSDYAFSNTLWDNSASYADSLRAARTKAQDTALKLKKLQYDFKAIATQIMRSKTSVGAREAANKARREVIRLKSQRQSGEYDDEELENAIAHAQAMERVAKKKVRHLQEEEMMKVTGGPCAGELEEKAEESEEAQEEERLDGESAERPEEAAGELDGDSAEGFSSADLAEIFASVGGGGDMAMQDMMSRLMEEMADSMQELLEESGLSELADSMFSAAGTEIDPADYKMMKLKHRSEEMKAIAKADAEYLKALFEQFEKQRNSAAAETFGTGTGQTVSGGIVGGVDIAAAISSGAAFVVSDTGGIDISV